MAAADFHRGFIETFTSFFAPLGIPGAFIVPNLPAGYAPWNVVVVANRVFVTYALQDASRYDPVTRPGNGIVDIYDLDGSFSRRFASNGALNVPSGVAQASASFGAFSNAILIGNFGDELINAFDSNSGQFLGSLKDGNGNAITNADLHSLIFGDGNAGSAHTLYLTAGLASRTNGLFASLAVNTSGAGPDFSLSANPSNVSVTAGQPPGFSVTATPVGNFRGSFAFACNAPAGITCNIGSQSISPATGATTVNVTATATASAHATAAAAFALPGFLFAGLGFFRRRNSIRRMFVAFVFLVFVVAGVTGCSSYGSSQMNPQPPTQSVSVAVTSGAISHTTLLTIRVQ